MDYLLNVQIEADDLAVLLEAGQQIILIRSVEPFSSSSQYVVWSSNPLLEYNSFSWTEDYGLFASRSQNTTGSRIFMGSILNTAQNNSQYIYDGLFEKSDDLDLESGSAVLNLYSSSASMQFGMCQSISLDGISSSVIPITQSTTPLNQNCLLEWPGWLTIFLGSGQEPGTIVSNILNNPLSIKYSPEINEVTVSYSSSAGGFEVI